MSFSQEVSLKISLDTSKAASDAQKLVGVMQQAGQKADAAFSGLNSTKKITEAINQEMFKQLSTTDKIKSVATQITELSKTKQAYEQGSKAQLEAQLAILQKQSQLRALIRQEAKETGAQAGGGGGSIGGAISGGMEAGGGGGGGALQSIGKNIVRRLSFMIAGQIIDASLSMITAPFKRAAKDAQDELEVSEARASAIDKAQIAERGTPTALLVAQTRLRKAEDEIRTQQQNISEMENSLGFNAKMSNPLDSTYKDVYEQRKAQLKQARIDQANYEQEVKITSRELYRENTLLGIKSESLYQISKLQYENKLTPVAAAGQNLADATAVLENIAKTGKNPTEIKQAENALAQARINFVAAQRSQLQQEISLSNQKDSLEEISNIQKKRKVNAVEIAQIELDAAKKAVSLTYRIGTPIERTAAENAQKQAQLAFNAAQDAQDNELLNIKNKRGAIEQTEKLQSKGNFNAVASAQIQLKLAKEAVELAKIYGTVVDVNNAKAAQRQIEANLRITQMGIQQRILDVNQSITEQATEGRFFPNGKPRPLSETERLAKQARKARQQARDAVLTGAPGEAAYQQERAMSLESGVAERIAFGSSKTKQVVTVDSSSLAPDLMTFKQLLEGINNSLKPTVN